MQQRQLFRKSMLLASLLLVYPFCFSQVTQQWVKRYTGSGNGDDRAEDVTVDASGNVYVTGSSNLGYATIKYDAAGNQLWAKTYEGGGATSLAVDASENVYVTGNVATIKYDAAGNELWIKHDVVGTSLAIDASGNVYVTGTTIANNGNADYTTIKYNAAGAKLWLRTYNGPIGSYDAPADLAVDGLGNVYVTGGSIGVESDDENPPDTDYATIKYDAAGNALWIRRYDGPAEHGDGGAVSLAVDASGNVYVTGRSGDYSNVDYATIKYDAAGKELWVKRYNGPQNGTDVATSLAVDASGNVYVTGSRDDGDYATIKYDALGNELWVKSYNGPGNLGDIASSLALDAVGNVYVTGRSYSDSSEFDYATIKYDGAGNELWVKRYNGPGNSYDVAAKLIIDASDYVYVTGSSFSNGTGLDYATIKYSQTQSSVVSSFTLINADSDEAIQELKDGDTINVAILTTIHLNIRANTDPATVGSVVFNLSGDEMRKHTENIVPYVLFADNNNGDYYSWTPTNGAYTLTATPYSAAKGKGEQGTPLTIHVTVIGQVVSSLILVNAETDQDIKTLHNGDVIDLATLPTTKLNIRAETHPDTVGSVVFNLNNRLIVRENYVPYAIGGDIKGDYRTWTLPTGRHTLTATPYNGKYGKGKKGRAHRVTFTVVDMAATTRAGNTEKQITDIAQNNGQRLRATPNPFFGQTMISFSVPQSGYTTLQVCDMKGVVVERLYQAHAEGGKAYNVSFKSKQLQSGAYVLRLFTDKQVQSYKLILIR